MATENQTAAPQPAQDAQPSGGTQTGAANSTVSSFARILANKEIAAMAQAQAAESAPEKPATEPESATPPATEEAKASAPEAQPQENATEETPAAESAEKAEDVPSNENPKLDPKLQEKIDKRIAKERLATKTAEGQVAQLQAQVDKLQKQIAQPLPEEKPVMVPVPANIPLAHIQDENALAQVLREAKQAQREAEELLDHDDIAKGIVIGDRTYSKADLKAIIRESRIIQEDHVPERSRFLAAQQQARAKTVEAFPYLNDRTSAEYMEHQAALRANPWLLSQPNADWIVAVQLEGIRAIAAKQEAAKKPATEKKPVTKPKPASDQVIVSTDSTAPRTSVPARNQVSTALNGKRGVGAKDYAEFLRQNEQLRNSR